MSKNKKVEAKEVIDVPENEMQKVDNSEEASEEEGLKKVPFWKSKKFAIGLGVIGTVAVAAVGIISTALSSSKPYELDSGYSWDSDEDSTCNDSDDNTSEETGSDDGSSEES